MFRKLHFILLVIITALASCQSPQEETSSKGMTHYFDFQDEVDRLAFLNPKVIKTERQESASVTKTVSVNWVEELSPFVESNINRKSTRDQYQQDFVRGGGSKVVKYTPLEDNLPVKTYELTYVEGIITSIFIKRATNVEETQFEELFYRPNIGYGWVKKNKLADNSYEIISEVSGKILSPPYGTWRGVLDIAGEKLPFNFDLNLQQDRLVMTFANGESRQDSKDVLLNRDSIKIKLPIAGSRIVAGVSEQKQMTGYWISVHQNGNMDKIPFRAEYGVIDRFDIKSDPVVADMSGEWKVTFGTGADSYKAIAKLNQVGSEIYGDFLTKSGDFLDLHGMVVRDDLYLSCFDGTHAYLMKASLDENRMLRGSFWNGELEPSSKITWRASR